MKIDGKSLVTTKNRPHTPKEGATKALVATSFFEEFEGRGGTGGVAARRGEGGGKEGGGRQRRAGGASLRSTSYYVLRTKF